MKSLPDFLTGLMVLLMAGAVVAQEKPPAPPTPPAATPSRPDNAPPAPPKSIPAPEISPEVMERLKEQKARGGFGGDEMINRRIAAFVRLREMMFNALKFDAARKARFETIFDDYFAGLLSGKYKPHLQPPPENMATPQQLPELKKQLEAAEKEGNQQKIGMLKGKIYAANIVLEPHVVDEPTFFYDYLGAELTPVERETFVPMVERWHLLRVAEVAPDNDFKHLLRAARDPMLGLTEEESKELRVMLLEAMRTVPFPQRNDQKIMTELAQKTKPKVLEQLNGKQKAQLEDTIKMLERWQNEDPEVAAKTRERLKNYVPSNQSPAPASGSTDSSGNKAAPPAKP